MKFGELAIGDIFEEKSDYRRHLPPKAFIKIEPLERKDGIYPSIKINAVDLTTGGTRKFKDHYEMLKMDDARMRHEIYLSVLKVESIEAS